MDNQYYIVMNNKECGPYAWEILVQMAQIIIHLLQVGIDLVNLFLVLLNVKQGDPADWDFEQVVNVIV